MSVTVVTPYTRVVDHGNVMNVTSRSQGFGRGLSPFFLGPVNLYNGHVAQNVENAWQYSKVYPQHDFFGMPKDYWWRWAKEGWAKRRADRYPMGKGKKPLYSWWDGKALSYVEARKKIYIPLYSKAVLVRDEWFQLRDWYHMNGHVALIDFDAYDHRALGYSWADVVNDPSRKMGHGFVLAMLLEEADLDEICK